MRELAISLEIQGSQTQVGTIKGINGADACFAYDDEYLASGAARPISLSLSLQSGPFSPGRTQAFFDGLLPEGFTRRCVAQDIGVDVNDYLSILSELGSECIGAVLVQDLADQGAQAAPAQYQPLAVGDIQALAEEGASESAQLVTEAHLSLAGASGKVGLYRERGQGGQNGSGWFLPKGLAPSTHIVKQSHVRLDDLVVNEQLCLKTAAACGLDVPDTFVIHLDGVEPLFATRRFDRTFEGAKSQISGHLMPLRLHQEDFAQAMGVPSSAKYEPAGQSYLQACFDLLRHASARAYEDAFKLWDLFIFDILIGNTDNHVKNISLTYNQTLDSIRLSPVYDVVSTTIYPKSSKQLAFRIGGEKDVRRVSKDDLALAADEAGIGRKAALRHADEMRAALEPALREQANLMCENGLPAAQEVCESILREVRDYELWK